MNEMLLQEIRAFQAIKPMADSYFGQRACRSSNLIKRLESGKTITFRTAERIRAFIAEHSKEAAQ